MLLKNINTINVSRFVFSAKSNITDKRCAYPSGAPRGYPSLGLKQGILKGEVSLYH
jgi:hypothetical protein